MLYKITKRMEVAGSHFLVLNYNSPCSRSHGHNWIVEVTVEGDHLNENGMLIDFTHLKQVVDELDHNHLNDVVNCNPTAENIAEWICNKVQEKIDKKWGSLEDCLPGMDILQTHFIQRPKVTLVSVQESEGNTAWFQPDSD